MSEQHSTNPYKLDKREATRLAKFTAKATVAGLATLGTLTGAQEVGKGFVDAVRGPEVPQLEKGQEGTETYRVKSGDTAWEIARSRVGHEEEVRPYVDHIMNQANDDGRPGLQVGEEVVVPKIEE